MIPELKTNVTVLIQGSSQGDKDTRTGVIKFLQRGSFLYVVPCAFFCESTSLKIFVQGNKVFSQSFYSLAVVFLFISQNKIWLQIFYNVVVEFFCYPDDGFVLSPRGGVDAEFCNACNTIIQSQVSK